MEGGWTHKTDQTPQHAYQQQQGGRAAAAAASYGGQYGYRYAVVDWGNERSVINRVVE